MAPRSIHHTAVLALAGLLAVTSPAVQEAPSAVAQSGFLETFDGTPGAPAPWQPPNWAVDATNSDMWAGDGQGMDAMAAHHGTDCAAHPATHPASTLAAAAFPCNDHVMTSISAGYGTVYLTPPAMLDIATGEAVLRFDMSTFRTVGRDWVDIWITPFSDQFALPLNLWLPPYQGEPRRAVQIKMEGASRFEAYVYTATKRSSAAKLPTANFNPYETVLTPSAVTRTPFELRLSKTHVKFGLPTHNLWWVDAPISPPLDWGSGVIQLGHHSYNPGKDCSGTCANTWHWDTVSISPSLPMTVIPTNPRWAVARKNGADTVTLAQPAPANATLRFAAVGDNIDLSYNGGATWTRATRQPADRWAPEHFSSYTAPIPAGVQTIKVKATGHSYIQTWMVANVNALAQGAAGPAPTSTPTVPPVATATNTATTPATSTQTATPFPTLTSTPTPTSAVCVANYFFGGSDTGLRETVAAAKCGH